MRALSRLATSQRECRGTPPCGLPFFENSRGTEAWIPNSTVPFHDGRLSPAAVDLHWRHSCRCGQPAPLRHPVTRLSPLRVARLWSRSEEHTSELQSLMRISYAVFCLKKKKKHYTIHTNIYQDTL